MAAKGPPAWWALLALSAAPAALAGNSTGSPVDHLCEGHDEEWGECPDQEPCDTCIPVDCRFSEWGEWYEGDGCIGLRFRHRSVQMANNQCGRPCEGAKIESDVHLKPECRDLTHDCTFTAWSEWSDCQDQLDQSIRVREVDKPPTLGGEPCAGGLQETRPCGGPEEQDCRFSQWAAWTECSSTCGEGRHTRERRVEAHAQHGGRTCSDALLETRNCTVKECPSADCKLDEWTEWSKCDRQHYQKIRSRKVLQSPQNGGEPCEKNLVETAGCDEPGPADCEVTDWTDWTACTGSCDGGQKQRERELARPNRNGGRCPLLALKETAACGEGSCEEGPPHDCELSEWSQWTDCMGDSGGSRTRTRKIDVFASQDAQGCEGPLKQVAPCPGDNTTGKKDCKWGSWEHWTDCTVSCGGGSKRRSRDVKVQPKEGGALCEPLEKLEIGPCNTQTCDDDCVDGLWGNWMQWTECSATCARGYKSRRRTVDVQPNHCGKLVHGQREEFALCDDLPPCEEDKDCKLSAWGDWSHCSCTCFGIRERNRRIVKFAAGNGQPCDNETLKAVEPCNPGPKEEVSAECGSGMPQDCDLGEWGDWSNCTTPCGGGQMERKRAIKVPPARGGKPCADSLLVTKPCNTQPCSAERCQDCKWGPWSDWGDCSNCGGQRWRHRSVETLPNHCGNACELTSAKEVSNCTSKCDDVMFCAWSEWSEMQCPERCGESASLRSRTLSSHKKEPKDYFFAGADSTKCAGSQLRSERCPSTEACAPDCQPRDCELGDWSDWNEPTCVGLCERQRSVKTTNNECGEPCNGTLLETKACEANCSLPADCELSDWDTWSDCDVDGSDQRYRRRHILTQPKNGGEPCVGHLEETGGCSGSGSVDCKLKDWDDWSDCTSSCGNGTQGRKREFAHQASNGGKPCSDSLEELRPCHGAAKGCPKAGIDCLLADWEEWSPCEASGQRERSRAVAQPAQAEGSPCIGALRETESCKDKPVDCQVSQWTEWEPCDKTCGVGQTQRQRQISRFPENGGKLCPKELIETKGCNAAPCDTQDCIVSGWLEWGGCSSTCGPGHQSRMRAITQLRGPGGAGCFFSLGATRPCDDNPACNITDCKWDDWSPWGECSVSCNGGVRKRQREISGMPTPGGKPCEARPREEVEPCGMGKCRDHCVDGAWEDWQAWTPCSVSCNGGTRFRQRKIAKMANKCGKEPEGFDRETEFCNADLSCEAPRDCELTDWADWGDCSASCSGVMERARKVKIYGRGDGAYCSGALRETHPCNPVEGEEQPEGCVVVPVTDCKLSDWQEWGECSATCDGGQHVREREIEQHPVNGGKACDDPLSEITECGRDPCAEGPPPVDCKFGDWQDWGACAKCSGERTRFREIVTFAAHGGKACEPFDAGEVGKCPRECDQEAFCSWDTWSEWGPCTTTCGSGGKRRRQRLLRLVEGGEQEEQDGGDVEILEVMKKYELLFQRTQSLESSHVQELAAAYVCGCVALLAIAGVVRGVTRIAGTAVRGEPEEEARVRQELQETQQPLVGASLGGVE